MSNEPRPNFQAFPATPWSLVGRAGVDDDLDAQRASLNDLLQRYLPALRAHLIYGRRMKPEAADDLLQGFVADKVVEQGIVASADRNKGKFRTFLLAALTRYHVSQIRKEKAQKRAPGDGGEIISYEEYHEPASEQRPERSFEIEWARQVVAEATRRTQRECEAAGKEKIWKLLKARILDPAVDGVEPLSYQELVDRFSLESPLQVSNLLVTGRRMYLRNLRSVIAEYSRDEAEVDEEMRDLRAIVAGVETV
jgi:RNA polymerase sigma-70 factor (ECF subfamily)